MSKKDQFLSISNMALMAKRIYSAHQNAGGQRPLAFFQEQIPTLMRGWPQAASIDSYESLTMDQDEEMAQINQDFFRSVEHQFLPAGGFARVKKLETVEDYLNFDTPRDEPTMVNASTYRRGNRFPLDRKITRNYDRDGDGLKGRSLHRENRETPGMDVLWAEVNRPYRAIDDNDARYYGQTTDDDSSTLINTSWN